MITNFYVHELIISSASLIKNKDIYHVYSTSCLSSTVLAVSEIKTWIKNQKEKNELSKITYTGNKS